MRNAILTCSTTLMEILGIMSGITMAELCLGVLALSGHYISIDSIDKSQKSALTFRLLHRSLLCFFSLVSLVTACALPPVFSNAPNTAWHPQKVQSESHDLCRCFQDLFLGCLPAALAVGTRFIHSCKFFLGFTRWFCCRLFAICFINYLVSVSHESIHPSQMCSMIRMNAIL